MTGAGETVAPALEAIGLDQDRRTELHRQGGSIKDLSRVIRVDRGWATLQGPTTTSRVELRSCPPVVVGDWLVEISGALERLARRTVLMRRATSERIEAQVMAANIDVVMITWALDTPPSVSRLRSLLVIARDSGARPLIVLTKADVPAADGGRIAVVTEAFDDVEVLVTSARSGEGMERVRSEAMGKTSVLLGASGSGKSTVTNLLLGDVVREVGEVKGTGEGRHTTTNRELLALPGGGALIDTPGIRTAVVWGDGEGVRISYPDLDELALTCRFSDCTHQGIAGCALEQAVLDGVIDRDRRDDYVAFVATRVALDEERDEAMRRAKRTQNRRPPR